MTIRQIMSNFLGRFGGSTAAEQVALIIETVQGLCAVYGAGVQARAIPDPERVGEQMSERGIAGGVELAFIAHDPLAKGAIRMIRPALLFGPARALTFRLVDAASHSRETLTEAGLIDVGQTILDWLLDVCGQNVKALVAKVPA